MKIFNPFYCPAVWYGQRVADAAQALEFALYRYRTAPIALFWKKARRDAVRSCLRDLRYELLIAASGQAQDTLKFMGDRRKGMLWI